jgi:hypothetical protein
LPHIDGSAEQPAMPHAGHAAEDFDQEAAETEMQVDAMDTARLDLRTRAVLDQLMTDLLDEPAPQVQGPAFARAVVSFADHQPPREAMAAPAPVQEDNERNDAPAALVTEPPLLELQAAMPSPLEETLESAEEAPPVGEEASVDVMATAAEPPAPETFDAPAEADFEPWHDIVEPEPSAVAALSGQPAAEQLIAHAEATPLPGLTQPAAPAPTPRDPLAAIRALSEDEKIALFT